MSKLAQLEITRLEDEAPAARYAIICDGQRLEVFAHDADQAERRAAKLYTRTHGHAPREMELHYLGARQ